MSPESVLCFDSDPEEQFVNFAELAFVQGR